MFRSSRKICPGICSIQKKRSTAKRNEVIQTPFSARSRASGYLRAQVFPPFKVLWALRPTVGIPLAYINTELVIDNWIKIAQATIYLGRRRRAFQALE